MKLFYASGSPYARIARVAVRELDLQSRVEEIEVTPRDPASSLLPYNPGAAALENAERRHKVWEWRGKRPHLSGFLDRVAQRPSFAATIQPEINL